MRAVRARAGADCHHRDRGEQATVTSLPVTEMS